MRVEGRTQASGLLTLSELIVEEELCINLRGRMERCSACQETCPSEAISLSIDAIDVDGEKCTGCNSCLPSCPAGALRATGFVPERFLQAMSGREQVHLHCRGSTDEGGGIVIPCYGVLDVRLAASARGEGVKSLALHGLNQCESCKLGDARGHVEALAGELKSWLGDEAPALDACPVADSGQQRQYQDQRHLDRRAFLRFGGVNAVAKVADWMVPGIGEEEDPDELPFFQRDELPQRAALYQQALVARADRIPWTDTKNLPWVARAVSDDCSACLSCGERCPTGALTAQVETEVRLLNFEAARCTDCQLCEQVCPEKAIIPSAVTDLEVLQQGPTLLHYRKLRQCGQCRTMFDPAPIGGGENCPVCSNEQDLDEEWLDMLSG